MLLVSKLSYETKKYRNKLSYTRNFEKNGDIKIKNYTKREIDINYIRGERIVYWITFIRLLMNLNAKISWIYMLFLENIFISYTYRDPGT